MTFSDEQKIKKALGEDLFRKIIASILLAQAEIIRTSGLPVGGGFISFRENKIVWSLTGTYVSRHGLNEFLRREDLEQIKEAAILSLKRGQKINGRDLRKLKIVAGKNQYIEIRLSSVKYSKYIPPLAGPTSSLDYSPEVIAELKKDSEAIENKKNSGVTVWALNVLIWLRTFFLSFFKRK